MKTMNLIKLTTEEKESLEKAINVINQISNKTGKSCVNIFSYLFQSSVCVDKDYLWLPFHGINVDDIED